MKLDKEFIRLQKHIEKLSKMREVTIARNHKKVLDELRFRLAKSYEQYGIEGQLTFEEMSKYRRIDKLDKEVVKLVTSLYKDNTKLIRGLLTGIATDTYTNTIVAVENATERKLKAIVKELNVSKVINEEMAGLKWPERMGKHRSDVIWNIQKEIKQGLKQGDTYGTMAKRLKKELEISTSKANQIIRTEGHRVHAQAKQDSLDSIARQGVKMTKKWLSSQDERTRSQHSDMDGVEVPYEDDFIMPDGAKGKGPGLIGQPQHDINCRCIMTIDIVKDDKEGYNDSKKENTERQEHLENIKNQNWMKSIKADDNKELITYFNNATDEELAFWNKYGDLVQGNLYDRNAGGHYSPMTKTVHLNIDKIDERSKRIGDTRDNRLFFHETGHLFDDMILRKDKGIRLVDELTEIRSKLESDYLNYANGILKENGLKEVKSLARFSREQKKVLIVDLKDDTHLKNSISDIIGGMTGGRIEGEYGHEDVYWKYPQALEKETIAHMFEARMMKGERKEVFEKYFKNTFDYFDEYINNLAR